MNKQRFGMVLPITLLAYCLIIMDSSILFTSSTEIGRTLNLSAASLSWVSNAYTLTFGGFLLLAGRLSDLLGRRRIFSMGILIFGLSSLIIGTSNNATIVILMRAVQGIGASAIAPTTLALMMDAYQGEMREKAIAYYGMTAGLGASAGLLIGGGLTTWISWQAGFLINVPLTIFVLYLTMRYVPNKPGEKVSIDYLGASLSVLGLGALIEGLISSQLSIVIVGLVILVGFVFLESRLKNPILPLQLFNNRVRSGAYFARMLFTMAMFPSWFLFPQIWQTVYHFTALEAGIAFLPTTFVQFLVSLTIGTLAQRFGNNTILLAGEIMLLLGLIWVGLSPVSSGYWLAFALPMVVLGIGQGLVLAPVTSAGLYKAPDKLAGIASGLTNTAHQIGGPIGLSIIVASTHTFHEEVRVMALISSVALVVVAVFVARKK